MYKLLLTLLTMLLFVPSITEAAKSDFYRDILSKGEFTIKYSIVQLPFHRTNKDAVLKKSGLFSKAQLQDVNIPNSDFSGLIVYSGTDRYIEMVTTEKQVRLKRSAGFDTKSTRKDNNMAGVCQLTKDGDIFNYYWDLKNGEKRYYSTFSDMGMFGSHHSSSVYALPVEWNPYHSLIDEYSYGNKVVADSLAAILPANKIIATPNTSQYKFIDAGTLPNNLYYEDFASDKNGIFSAIRYYFKGDNLVKISTIRYAKDSANSTGYEKSVINIEDFSAVADKTYLSLPSSLKVKGGRDKEVK